MCTGTRSKFAESFTPESVKSEYFMDSNRESKSEASKANAENSDLRLQHVPDKVFEILSKISCVRSFFISRSTSNLVIQTIGHKKHNRHVKIINAKLENCGIPANKISWEKLTIAPSSKPEAQCELSNFVPSMICSSGAS